MIITAQPAPVRVSTREPFDIYVGPRVTRAANPRITRGAPDAYHNPFRLGRHPSDKRASLTRYLAVWRRRLAGKRRHAWLERLAALGNKRVACTCGRPPAGWSGPWCHVDVLVALYNEFVLNRRPPGVQLLAETDEYQLAMREVKYRLAQARPSDGIRHRQPPFLSPWEGRP